VTVLIHQYDTSVGANGNDGDCAGMHNGVVRHNPPGREFDLIMPNIKPPRTTYGGSNNFHYRVDTHFWSH
jgi:hypothetical protein